VRHHQRKPREPALNQKEKKEEKQSGAAIRAAPLSNSARNKLRTENRQLTTGFFLSGSAALERPA
jgi:hypothetical protein